MKTCHYPGYVIRLQKERLQAKSKNLHEEICTKKLARKRCPSLLNIQLFAKKNKKSGLHFFSNTQRISHYCDTSKRKPKHTKMGDMQKLRIFY